MTSKGYLKNLILQNHRGKNLKIKFSLALALMFQIVRMPSISKLQK